MGYDTEIREPLDRAAWEQREIYAHLGVALYFCQVVEAALVNHLRLLHQAISGHPMTESEGDELSEKLFSNTLGRNIENVKQLVGEEGEWVLADRMGDTLTLRNELVHDWMRARVMLQGTSENRLAMIGELRDAIAVLEEAESEIRERTRSMLAKAGVPEGFVQEEHQRLLDLAARGAEDDDPPAHFSRRRDV